MSLAERLRRTSQETATIDGRASGAVPQVPACSTCGGRATVYLPWVGEMPCRDCGGTGVKVG